MPKTMTEAIFSARSPYSNQSQGPDKRILFVCSAGMLRSATAARIYAARYNTRAAGSAIYALIPVTDELMLWADTAVFMQYENYQHINNRFDLKTFDCKIKILDIPDEYNHMDPRLIKHLEMQFEPIN